MNNNTNGSERLEGKFEVTATIEMLSAALDVLNGRHDVAVGGEQYKKIVDAVGEIHATAKLLDAQVKAVESELFADVPRPVNPKTAQPVKTLNISGNAFKLKADYKDAAVLEVPEDVVKAEAIREIAQVALGANCFSRLFSLSVSNIKAVDIAKFPEAVQTILLDNGYGIEERVSYPAPEILKK